MALAYRPQRPAIRKWGLLLGALAGYYTLQQPIQDSLHLIQIQVLHSKQIISQELGRWYSQAQTIRHLRLILERSQQKLADLHYLEQEWDGVYAENKALRDTLRLALPQRYRVTSVQPNYIHQTAQAQYVLARSGVPIPQGLWVVQGKNILGKTGLSAHGSQRITLISDPGFSTPVQVGKQALLGMIRGNGQGELNLDYINDSAQVSLGEAVYLHRPELAQRLLVGHISHIEPSPERTFQRIKVQAAYQLNYQSWLNIIR